jgi:hypothetical protein
MNFAKPRAFTRVDNQTEIEGSMQDLLRRESGTIRRGDDSSSDPATNDLSALLRQVSIDSTREIDRLIDDLKTLRGKLEDDGNRVQREIVGYVSLSQSVIQLTKIVSESMSHVKKLPDAPTIDAEVVPLEKEM